jgi:hypothetical protein
MACKKGETYLHFSYISIRFAILWDFMQRKVVFSYRRFGTTCQVSSSRVKLSVTNYQRVLHYIPKNRSSNVHRGFSMTTHNVAITGTVKLTYSCTHLTIHIKTYSFSTKLSLKLTVMGLNM